MQYGPKDSKIKEYRIRRLLLYMTRADKLYSLPVILVLGYVPLIMRFSEYDPGLSVVPWGYEGTETDFFLIWKMRIMLVLSAIMLLLLIHRQRAIDKEHV